MEEGDALPRGHYEGAVYYPPGMGTYGPLVSALCGDFPDVDRSVVELVVSEAGGDPEHASRLLIQLSDKATSEGPSVLSPLRQCLSDCLGDGTFADCCVECADGVRLRAHQWLLRARSPLLAMILDSLGSPLPLSAHDEGSGGHDSAALPCIDASHVGADMVQMVLQYLYTGYVKMNAESRFGVLQLADEWCLDRLRALAEDSPNAPPCTFKQDMVACWRRMQQLALVGCGDGDDTQSMGQGDVALLVEQRVLPAHRMALVSVPYFHSLLHPTSPMCSSARRIPIGDVDYSIMETIIGFVYADGDAALLGLGVVEAERLILLMYAAAQFVVQPLLDWVEKELLAILSEDSVLPLLQASATVCPSLHRACFEVALAHFDYVRALPDFVELDPSLAEALTSRYEAGRDEALEGFFERMTGQDRKEIRSTVAQEARSFLFAQLRCMRVPPLQSEEDAAMAYELNDVVLRLLTPQQADADVAAGLGLDGVEGGNAAGDDDGAAPEGEEEVVEAGEVEMAALSPAQRAPCPFNVPITEPIFDVIIARASLTIVVSHVCILITGAHWQYQHVRTGATGNGSLDCLIQGVTIRLAYDVTSGGLGVPKLVPQQCSSEVRDVQVRVDKLFYSLLAKLFKRRIQAAITNAIDEVLVTNIASLTEDVNSLGASLIASARLQQLHS